LSTSADVPTTFVEVLTASVEVFMASVEGLMDCTGVAVSIGGFFAFLPLSTSSGLDARSSRVNFLGRISSVLISCFTRKLEAIF
jgi:hypothetical protein